ncbi:MAG: sigma-54 dependent transcriptional regulator [bacterium]|jgi:DNA-binding NtrC family response regulator|nr:sigma-54 dependent transcriptional regulator [candidate division KSB1 bacterium]MDH7560067.1 sigma-54 dependent transcriptional regulator [bacterium]
MAENASKVRIRALTVEDDPLMRESIITALQGKCSVSGVESGEKALKYLERERWDIVLIDIGLPGMDGFALLEKIRAAHEDVVCIMITGYGQPENVVRAMRLGAYDYLTKPISRENLFHTVEKAAERVALKQEIEQLRRVEVERNRLDQIVCQSPAMKEIMVMVDKLIKVPGATVLITGETGTGKDLIARAIHYLGQRFQHPFVVVNCAAIPENLWESELFGYERGTFTGGLDKGKPGKFELAHRGTLFLDEVAETPLSQQAKLLHVIENQEFYRVGGTEKIQVDVQIIAATNRDLQAAVREGKFRQDLYYRLNVAQIAIPPLREHKEDIRPLAKLYLKEFNRKFNKSFVRIPDGTRRLLEEYHWPGNVRELRNVIERAVLTHDGEELRPEFLDFVRREEGGAPSAGFSLPPDGIDLEEVEKNLLKQALERAGGNKAQAARLLGITKPTLVYRLEKYGIA